jgi:hypothetical protein
MPLANTPITAAAIRARPVCDLIMIFSPVRLLGVVEGAAVRPRLSYVEANRMNAGFIPAGENFLRKDADYAS